MIEAADQVAPWSSEYLIQMSGLFPLPGGSLDA
jgi:hypothetical protein